MADRESTLRRYLEIWIRDARVNELDDLVTSDYLGHMGSRDRDLEQLREYIVANRRRGSDVRFEVLHRFSEGDHVATRIVAHATDHETGSRLSACGLSISRWEDGLLAEEWAVWERLAPSCETRAPYVSRTLGARSHLALQSPRSQGDMHPHPAALGASP
jgi:predicted ester cyclase